MPKAAYRDDFMKKKLLSAARFEPGPSRAAGKRATLDHCDQQRKKLKKILHDTKICRKRAHPLVIFPPKIGNNEKLSSYHKTGVWMSASIFHLSATPSVAKLLPFVFLVRVEIVAVDRFDMFPQRARVRVALGAATSHAHIRLLLAQTRTLETMQHLVQSCATCRNGYCKHARVQPLTKWLLLLNIIIYYANCSIHIPLDKMQFLGNHMRV